MKYTETKLSSYCTFYVLRHAHSTDQEKGYFSGHSNAPLSQYGREQAKSYAQHLSHVSFDAAFASDLIRAQETTRSILENSGIDIKTSTLLRERSYGEIDGKKPTESFLKAYQDFFTLSYSERLNIRLVPGMETDQEIISRFLAFLKEVAATYSGKKILVVSHANIMKTFLVHLGFSTHAELPSGSIPNLSYFILHSNGSNSILNQAIGIHKIEKR